MKGNFHVRCGAGENEEITSNHYLLLFYAFRGSDPKYIQEFIYRYPNSERLFLGDNYRCKSEILAPVISSIERNKVRVPKEIRAYNDGGEIEVVPVGKDMSLLASVIKNDTEGMYGAEFDDIGILVRMNAQRMIIADELVENGVQVDIGNMNYSLRSNRVYKAIVGIILAIKEEDNNKFAEFGRIMFQSLHYTVMTKYKNDTRRNWYEEAVEENRYGLSEGVLKQVLDIKGTNNMKNAVGYVWGLVGDYYKGLAKRGYGSITNTIDVFRHVFSITEGLTVKQFIKSEHIKENFLSLYCNSGNGVQIKTLHSVKGLEFKTVYLVGLDSMKFPSAGHIERLREKHGEGKAQEYIEEERRLFYVGWTRAMDRLVLSYNEEDPSMFLSEVSGLELPGVVSIEG